MMVPTVHLNGTSRNELIDRIRIAYDSLTAAINDLDKTRPNRRDYYPQGHEAIGKALDEHRDRIKRVTAVQDELIEIWEKLCDAA